MPRLPLVVIFAVQLMNYASARDVQLWDDDWRFHLGDIPQATERDFADGAWYEVDLPHDWSIGKKTDPGAPSGGDGGYFPTGIGWYRKELAVKPEWEGRRVWLDFEGVATTCQIFLNGKKIGSHHYAYTPIHLDITEHVDFDQPNLLAVRVDNSKQPNSRWYTGSGIYRHVWLTLVDPVHVRRSSPRITTRSISGAATTVDVALRIVNKSSETRRTEYEGHIVGDNGIQVAAFRGERQVGPDEDVLLTHESIEIANAKLWSFGDPSLYQLQLRVASGDAVTVPFGIRTVEVSPDKGFLLNGHSIELFGGCVHHDNGLLGAAAFDRAEERRVEMLKAAGFNAIRTSHNPPSPAFLEACDRLGMLVIDEAFDGWAEPKKKYDYSTVFEHEWANDLRAMIDRDRNHPSVVMWSIGNEVYERGSEVGEGIARVLAGLARSLDPTRPVTIALNGLEKKEDWPNLDPMFAAVDVAGYNYELHRHAGDHERVPRRVMYSSESFSSAAFDGWQAAKHYPYVIGDFVWSGLDYLGEAGIGRAFPPDEPVRAHWQGPHHPWHGAYCGDVDITGWRKPISHYRNIIWDRGERLHVAVLIPTADGRPWGLGQWALPPALSSWNWPGQEGKPLTVEVYSRYDAVRLYLEDELIGEEPTTELERFRASFSLPYSPGALRAVGIHGGKEVEEFVLTTAGPTRAIRLAADRPQIAADGQDLAFIGVELVDAEGRLNTSLDEPLEYQLEGPGAIVGIGSGNLTSREPYHANPRHTYHGRALVVVRSSHRAGLLKLTARAPGLAEATINVEARKGE